MQLRRSLSFGIDALEVSEEAVRAVPALRLRFALRLIQAWAQALPKALLALLTLAATLMPGTERQALAQLGRTVPPESHQNAIELLYSGDYRRAARQSTSDLRGAVKTLQARWVDSICFQTMLGETFYQQGNNLAALEHFDQACQLYLAYSKWLLKVTFPPLRAGNNRGRQIPPWGQSGRQPIYAEFSGSMLVSMGKIDHTLERDRGGVIQAAQYWQVDVVEVMRCAGLAIRRRNELLGPLGPTDRLTKELVETMSRGGGAPAGHWANAWIELLLGTALMGIDKDKQALTHIDRAILLQGRMDHPLTGAALLVKGHLARRSGNAQAAAELYYEASIAGFVYGDYDVVTDALWWGHVNHAAAGGAGVYPPLEGVVSWADRKNLDHIELVMRGALAESLINAGNLGVAEAVLTGGGRMSRDVLGGRHAPRNNALSGSLVLLQGKLEQGGKTLSSAVEAYAAVSLANFHTNLANLRLDTGALSPRLAMDVYLELLSDPSPSEWTLDPLDQMAHMSSDQSAALDRWFLAAIVRREVPVAINISEIAKRRRYLLAKPLGGRVMALRSLLDKPDDQLEKAVRLQKLAIVATIPDYKKLAAETVRLQQQLTDGGKIATDGKLTSEADKALESIGKGALKQEAMLLRRAYTRLPAAILFPPTSTIEQTREVLTDGEAILAFHQVSGALHGFLIAREAEHHWILPDPRNLATSIGEMLKEFGNHTKSRTLAPEDVNSDAWQESAKNVANLILQNSRLDLAQTDRLTVVPDGALWHVPFEALRVDHRAGQVTLIDAATIRTAPTIGLAFGPPPTPRAKSKTLLLTDRISGSSTEQEAAENRQQRLAATAEDCTQFSAPVPAASPRLAGLFDRLLVTAQSDLKPASGGNFSPAPVDRNQQVGKLANWVALPNGRPTHWVLGGVSTIADSGLRLGRRGKNVNTAAGGELFYASCDMIAAGARNALVTRWQTGGGRQHELLREYALQIGEMPAEEAWHRSVLLNRGTQLDPADEPRLKWNERDGQPPYAKHPLFWSGFLLVDTVSRPQPELTDKQDVPADNQVAPKEDVKRRDIGGQ